VSYSTPAIAASPFAAIPFVPGTATEPTTAQIQEWLDKHTVVLDSILTGLGYTSPTDTESDAYAWCAEANRLYVGSQIGAALDAPRDTENHPAIYLKRLYDEMMAQLRNGDFDALFDTAGTTANAYGSENFPDAVYSWTTEW
jgi:hypothetical protein